MISRLPIALIFLRGAAGLVFILLWLERTRPGFFIALLLVGFLSDVADGVIARRFGVATLASRRLDTRVDLFFYECAIFVALKYASFPLTRLLPWMVAYLALFLIRNVIDFLRYRASPSYHMWSGKLWSVLIAIHIVALFLGAQAFFLVPLAFSFYVVNAIEGITTSLMLPHPCKDIPSLWHALTLYRRHFSHA